MSHTNFFHFFHFSERKQENMMMPFKIVIVKSEVNGRKMMLFCRKFTFGMMQCDMNHSVRSG